MSFNSIHFLVFFPIVVCLYYIIPRKVRYIWLLIASYYFYMSWNPKYVILIAASTLLTWGTSLLIEKRQSKCLLFSCIGVNLAILFLFKYFDFGIESINRLLGKIGVSLITNPFDFILPVGISFYTFQAIGYIIDVYQGRTKAEHNLLKYALFVSFFPQLVAGPIERSEHFLKQISQSTRKTSGDIYRQITNGLIYMLYGFFMKLVIADRVAILVNHVWDEWYLYGGIELLVATCCFSIQIYCDFASYSTIAIGAAQVMGFELMENFKAPYFALSVKEFWRRWHISLSTWFRDYVYIPLGGNRVSKVRKYVNLMITFLLSGLWHGASWSFVVWGGLHGFYQIVGEMTAPLRDKIYPYIGLKKDTAFFKAGSVLCTFLLTSVAWIFFRSSGIHAAVSFCANIVRMWNPWVIFDGTLFTLGLSLYEWNILIIALVVLIVADYVRIKKDMRFDAILEEQGALCKALVIVFLCVYIFIFGIYGGGYDESQFIYFQF